MWKKIRGYVALAIFAALALTGVVTHTALNQDPPVKGFSSFCGTAAHAIVP